MAGGGSRSAGNGEAAAWMRTPATRLKSVAAAQVDDLIRKMKRWKPGGYLDGTEAGKGLARRTGAA